MRANRFDEAEPYFKGAVALDPSVARAYEGLGFIAMRRNKYSEAREHLKQAVSRDSKNHLAHYYYATTLYRDLGGAELKPDVAREITDKLKTSVKLMPGFAPAYSMLGFMYLATGEDLAEGAELLKTALRAAPQNKYLAINLAQIQVRLQDYESAKKTLAPLLASDDDDGLKQNAGSIMSEIENYTRPLPESKATNSNATIIAPSGGTAPAYPQNPSIKIEGTETVSGHLSAIECPGNGMQLVLRTQEKLLRFSVSDPVKLQLFSRVPGLSVTIGCGAINLEAIVYCSSTLVQNYALSAQDFSCYSSQRVLEVWL